MKEERCPMCSAFAPDPCMICETRDGIDKRARDRGESVPTRAPVPMCGKKWCIGCDAHAILEWTGVGFRLHSIVEGCLDQLVNGPEWPDTTGPKLLVSMAMFFAHPDYEPAPLPSWFDA